MRNIWCELPLEIKDKANLGKVKLEDVFKVCLEAPVSEDEKFRLVEALTDTDTAVALFSFNKEHSKNAEPIVFARVGKLIKREENNPGLITSFKVLRELYRMNTEGVPISKESLFRFAEVFSQKSEYFYTKLLYTIAILSAMMYNANNLIYSAFYIGGEDVWL